jgi:hypothetical protein
MKTRIFVGLCIALCWQAKGQTNPALTNSTNPEPSATLTGSGVTNEIVTVSGATYENTRVERVEPDGLTVSYIPSGGGLGLSKIKFDELADEWRQRYGYDPKKKAAYEKEQIRAAAWWREYMITNYEAAVARRLAREKAEAEAEAQAKAELEKAAAEAAGTTVTNQPQTNVIQPQTPEAQKAAAEAATEAAAAMATTNQPQTNVIQPPPPQH